MLTPLTPNTSATLWVADLFTLQPALCYHLGPVNFILLSGIPNEWLSSLAPSPLPPLKRHQRLCSFQAAMGWLKKCHVWVTIIDHLGDYLVTMGPYVAQNAIGAHWPPKGPF